ncbi:MAG: thrombospondin type 3 repeat-containing protein, partial [Planctomycetota bacterium]
RTGIGGDGDRCADCHALPFGTDGKGSFELETQEFKVAHLRNMYQKVGMFGQAMPRIVREPQILEATPTAHLGDQVRGFGYLHDGAVPTLFEFFRVQFFPIAPFTFPDQPGFTGDQKVRALVDFMMAFPTGLEPVVGHQVTLSQDTLEARRERYDVFIERAEEGDCDVVVSGVVGGVHRGFQYLAGGIYQSDREADRPNEAELFSRIGEGEMITVTAVPPGSGRRIAIDRDEDGFLDGDELAQGSDPADPLSVPAVDEGEFLRGNCNGDDNLDISDGVFGLLYLFVEGAAPPCFASCDSNVDGNFDISDSVYTLNYLFLGGPAPGAAPACETAPREDCEVDVCAAE